MSTATEPDADLMFLTTSMLLYVAFCPIPTISSYTKLSSIALDAVDNVAPLAMRPRFTASLVRSFSSASPVPT